MDDEDPPPPPEDEEELYECDIEPKSSFFYRAFPQTHSRRSNLGEYAAH
jgi:hypothetical protein